MYESQSHEDNDSNTIEHLLAKKAVDHRGLDWVMTAGLFQSKFIYGVKTSTKN